MHSIHVDDG